MWQVHTVQKQNAFSSPMLYDIISVLLITFFLCYTSHTLANPHKILFLQLLRLHQSHIEDKKCCTLVKYLFDHPSLRELDFSHNLIGDKGARAIGKLLNRSKLETLNMCDNNIRGPGAKAIAHALSKNSTLFSLNLRLNRLRDEGGEAIGKALLNNNILRHLHLGGNEVTGPTAIALSKVLVQNNTLKAINLSCNNLGVVSELLFIDPCYQEGSKS